MKIMAFLIASLLVFTLSGCEVNSNHSISYREYVDSLRGENNLAHWSANVPPLATLSGLGTMAATNKYLGRTANTYTSTQVVELLQRSPLPNNEIIFWACTLAEVGGFDATSTIPVNYTEMAKVDMSSSSVKNLDDARSIIFHVLASKCLGNSINVPQRLKTDIATKAFESPTLALLAQKAGLTDAQTYSITSPTVKGTESDLMKYGCTKWVFAELAAIEHFSGSVSKSALDCLKSGTPDFTDPQILYFLVLAELDRNKIKLLIESNTEVIKKWTQLTESLTSDWDTPIGLGSISATRDATRLLLINNEDPLSWMQDGVNTALINLKDGSWKPTAAESADLWLLCSALNMQCPSHLETTVLKELQTLPPTMASFPPANDAEVSRIVETAIWTKMQFKLACEAKNFRKWMDTAPLTTIAIASEQMVCYDNDLITASEAEETAIQKLIAGEVESGVAWAELRFLISPTIPNEYSAQMRQAWDSMMDKVPEKERSGISAAPPLSLELLYANLEQWIKPCNNQC